MVASVCMRRSTFEIAWRWVTHEELGAPEDEHDDECGQRDQEVTISERVEDDRRQKVLEAVDKSHLWRTDMWAWASAWTRTWGWTWT